jgi:hypothetical protein
MQHFMEQAVQHKADLAFATSGASGVLAWIDQATVVVDFAAGIVAVITGCLAIAWYISRFIRQHRDKDGE